MQLLTFHAFVSKNNNNTRYIRFLWSYSRLLNKPSKVNLIFGKNTVIAKKISASPYIWICLKFSMRQLNWSVKLVRNKYLYDLQIVVLGLAVCVCEWKLTHDTVVTGSYIFTVTIYVFYSVSLNIITSFWYTLFKSKTCIR